MKRLLIVAALTLTGCEPSELQPVAVGGAVGGARYAAPASQPAQPLAPGIHRIDNPDQPIEGQIIDYVWGDTLNEAEAKCRQIAAQTGTTFDRVRRTSQRGQKWECHVLSNHPEPEPDDRRQR